MVHESRLNQLFIHGSRINKKKLVRVDTKDLIILNHDSRIKKPNHYSRENKSPNHTSPKKYM